jgi:hypothetical protein
VFDFGVLALHGIITRPYREAPDPDLQFGFRIEACGQVVFDTEDGDGRIRCRGSWQRTLAAIAQQLDEKFGPAPSPGQNAHTVH